MTGFMTGQSMLGYQPYQGPMPYQQAGAFPNATVMGGVPSVGGAPSLTGMQGFDSFSSMGAMGGMPSMGSMGSMGNMSSMSGNMMGSPQISGSTLQLMAQINSMMASVMQGLMQFVQVMMQAVTQKQSQPSTETPSTTTGDTPTENTPTSNPKTTNGPPGEVGKDPKEAVKFFMDKGWSREQAAGIVANLEHESGLRTDAVGDGGKAYGVAQWHPDRQANYTKFAQKNGLKNTNIRNATLAEQLAFVHYELTEGNEKSAGNKVKAASSANSAAAAFCRYYERPADPDGQSAKRGKRAQELV